MVLSMHSRLKILVSVIALLAMNASVLGSLMLLSTAPAYAANALDTHAHIDCIKTKLCRDIVNSDDILGQYVGHDEPSNAFYSNAPGSGNRNLWFLKLPTDPKPKANETPKANQTFNFELHPASWLGMIMCDTQSYPEQVSTCKPDSDSNITSSQNLAHHTGSGFMEMQFYPPGWVSWPSGNSCGATQWCAALNIDSVSADPINGTQLNPSCAALTGIEYVNFAFVTKSGVAQAPANPVQSTPATFTPNPSKDLFMNSGDTLEVKMGDTPSGLRIDILDLTTGQHGSMTASAANGFGQVKFAPAPSKECTNIPYNFHPMYSTSSTQAILPWGGIPGNISFTDEIGHFDYCTNINTTTGTCSGQEGRPTDLESHDGDDNFCLTAGQSLLINVSGCTDSNTGFDGTSYLKNAWPDGNTGLHPTPIQFSSPLTGSDYNTVYSRSAFQTDLPFIENTCDITTGAGCTLIPTTDDNAPAEFYPYFSSTHFAQQLNGESHTPLCVWQFGDSIPGSISDFGKNAQYGTLNLFTSLTVGGGGAVEQDFTYFGHTPEQNPCQPQS